MLATETASPPSADRPLARLLRPLAAWPNVTSLFLIVLLLANYFKPFGDFDFTWQIRTGEQIIQRGELRTADAFSYTINGQRVPDFEWLYEVTLWLVWSALGFGGLKLLKTLLVVTPLLILARRLRGEGIKPHGVLATLIVAIIVANPAWNLRPLYCTTIGLLLVSGWLHEHCTGRRPLTWWLPVVMLLWANLHPGVITGQGLLLGAIAWEWLNRLVKLNAPLDRRGCWRLTAIGGLGLAATFLSPDPLDRLLYPFRPELAHPVQRLFSEMRPLHTVFFDLPLLTGVTYAVALLVGLTVVCRFRRYRLWEVALLAGLAGLAGLATRSVQDWVLNMLALGVPHLVALVRQAARTDRRRRWVAGLLRLDGLVKRALVGRLFRLQPAWPAAVLALLVVVSLIPPLARDMPVRELPGCPTAAVDRIAELGLSGRFFGSPDYGSYVTWRLRERARSYVDTRGFFFPPTLIEDACYLPQQAPGWRERLDRVLDEYHTDYFLLEVDGPRGQLWRALRPHVRPIYCDDQAVVLSAAEVRRGVRRLEPNAHASR